MSRIPDFIESLEKMKEVHIRKNEDYATSTNPFSNFDFSESCIKHFTHDHDKVFMVFISTKLARLATLLSSDRIPNHESTDDSFIDIANYVLLWKAYRREGKIDAIRKLMEDAIDNFPPLPEFVANEPVNFKCQIHDIINCANCITENKEFYAAI